MTLSAVLLFPLFGALLLLAVPPRNARLTRLTALLAALGTFVLSLALVNLNPYDSGLQLEEKYRWFSLGGLDLHYHLGVDGLSLWLVLLTTFLTPLALLGSWKYVAKRVWEFSLAMLVLETGLLGVFLAADLWLFFVFWELTLLPMYLLIGVWGHEGRVYAATKFVLYTATGSLLMFVALVWLHLKVAASGAADFSLPTAMRLFAGQGLSATQLWLFGAFALAFAIKVPMVPFHTWLPRAHVEAPTPGSVLLAAVLLKMGVYGFLRLALPLFPAVAVAVAPWGAALAVAGIVYGALLALAQRDLKTLIAYSSVSHLGYAMLGLFALTRDGVTGCLVVLVAHGFSSAGLFLLAGMLYERRQTRQIAAFGGLARPLPRLAALFTLITLSAIGLPTTAGFVGEFTALFGAFQRYPALAAVGGLGVILGAVYMLWTVQRVFYGPLELEENRNLPDASLRELVVLVPLVLVIFLFGLQPKLLTDRSAAAVERLLRHVQTQSHPPTPLPPGGILVPMPPRPSRPPRAPAASPSPRPETGRGAVTPPVSPAASPSLPPIPTFPDLPATPAVPAIPATPPVGGAP